MWHHLRLESADIDSIFAPLAQRGAEFNRPWSIAELQLSEEDLDWLAHWLVKLPATITIAEDGLPGYTLPPEKLGAILIVLGAERCRRFSNEDSVWPVLSGLIARDHPLRAKLFLENGQPTYLTKRAINEAARALNIRNSMGIEGTQQWFVTIKLQFGFTYRGAKRRIAEWLVGLGTPLAVQYLMDPSGPPELVSKSFQHMWSTLRQFRRGAIDENQARESLQNSPWVKADWISDLLMEAVKHIDVLEPGSDGSPYAQPVPDEGLPEERGPLESIVLSWPNGGRPRISFHLDREAIAAECRGANCSEVDFHVDGQWTYRWTLLPDGTWDGRELVPAEPGSEPQRINLSPKILAIHSGNGDLIQQWDLADFGLQSDVLVFNLDSGQLIEFGIESLAPDSHYALICDRAYQLEGCNPINIYEPPNSSRRAIQLPCPLTGNLRLSYEGFTLWQPVAPQGESRAQVIATLKTHENATIHVGDKTRLVVEGLPAEASDVKLLVGKRPEAVERFDGIWATSNEVVITPELAIGQKKVRVRFLLNGNSITLIPKRTLRLKGLATYFRDDRNPEAEPKLKLLKSGHCIRKTTDGVQLRVWIPDEVTRARVFEGHYFVGPLRHGRVKLKDFSGFGGELIIKANESYTFENTCYESGWIRIVLPIGPSQPVHVCLDMKREPLPFYHRFVVWAPRPNGRSELECLPSEKLITATRSADWQVVVPPYIFAIAVTWQGTWFGAYWWKERLRDYNFQPTTVFFASARWLHLPVIEPELMSWFELLVRANPSAFLEAWLQDKGLPFGVQKLDHELGYDTIIRQFIGCWRPDSGYCSRAVELITGKEPLTFEALLSSVDNVRRYSLPLLWWISYRLASAGESTLRRAISSLLGIEVVQFDRLASYRLAGLKRNTLEYCTFHEVQIEDLTGSILSWLEHPGTTLPEQIRRDMLLILSHEDGQRYLATRVLLKRIPGLGAAR